MKNTIRFWGVRGSIAASNRNTMSVGGNTSCTEVRLAEERIILDGGSGLRELGVNQGKEPLNAYLLFSHLHWDHIQGVPFFGPLFNPKSQVTLVGPKGLRQALSTQMSQPMFPVSMEVFPAQIAFLEIDPGESFQIGAVRVRTCSLRHPGGAIGYRLESDQATVVYACDTEHPADSVDQPLVEFAKDADVLIYDAQYTPEEYPSRVGWGHSTYERAAEVARHSHVRQLFLSHHDPARTDDAVAEIEQQGQALFSDTCAAREGYTLDLSESAAQVPSEKMLVDPDSLSIFESFLRQLK